MPDTSKIWFITGVGRGLGKALTEAVLRQGGIVIGTTRDGKAAGYPASAKLHLLPLEITDPAAIVSTVGEAHALHGRLDVNFHGTRRVVQAVLPHLRRQRSGHIVNITSIAGVAPNSGSGFYSAAKFAVEGMSQSLAQEVAPFGIKVTLIEPGAFRTDFLSDHSIRATQATIDDYAATVGAALGRLQSMAGKQIGDPERGAAAIIAAVEAAEPPLHLLLGSDALKRTRDKLAKLALEMEKWSATTLGTDF